MLYPYFGVTLRQKAVFRSCLNLATLYLNLRHIQRHSVSLDSGIYAPVFANKGRESHDYGGQGRLDVLVGVVDQLLNAGEELRHDGVRPVVLTQGLAECCHNTQHGGERERERERERLYTSEGERGPIYYTETYIRTCMSNRYHKPIVRRPPVICGHTC